MSLESASSSEALETPQKNVEDVEKRQEYQESIPESGPKVTKNGHTPIGTLPGETDQIGVDKSCDDEVEKEAFLLEIATKVYESVITPNQYDVNDHHQSSPSLFMIVIHFTQVQILYELVPP